MGRIISSKGREYSLGRCRAFLRELRVSNHLSHKGRTRKNVKMDVKWTSETCRVRWRGVVVAFPLFQWGLWPAGPPHLLQIHHPLTLPTRNVWIMWQPGQREMDQCLRWPSVQLLIPYSWYSAWVSVCVWITSQVELSFDIHKIFTVSHRLFRGFALAFTHVLLSRGKTFVSRMKLEISISLFALHQLHHDCLEKKRYLRVLIPFKREKKQSSWWLMSMQQMLHSFPVR